MPWLILLPIFFLPPGRAMALPIDLLLEPGETLVVRFSYASVPEGFDAGIGFVALWDLADPSPALTVGLRDDSGRLLASVPLDHAPLGIVPSFGPCGSLCFPADVSDVLATRSGTFFLAHDGGGTLRLSSFRGIGNDGAGGEDSLEGFAATFAVVPEPGVGLLGLAAAVWVACLWRAPAQDRRRVRRWVRSHGHEWGPSRSRGAVRAPRPSSPGTRR